MSRTAKRVPVSSGESASGVGILSVSANEKRVPLAIMFYEPEKKALQFDRAAGIGLKEFVGIMRQFFPNYGLPETKG